MGQPTFRVDTAPLGVLLVRKSARLLGLVAGIGLFLWLLNSAPRPADLSPDGYQALCVLVLAVFLWSTNVLPAGITGILAMVLVGTLVELRGGLSAYQLFGSQALFFLLGSFILSASLKETGLSNRMALAFISRWGRTPRRLSLALFLISIIFSFFIISHGVAALFLPIVLEIIVTINEGVKHDWSAEDHDLDPASIIDMNELWNSEEGRVHQYKSAGTGFGKQLLLILSFGTAIGGTGSLLGSGRATLVYEYLELKGRAVSFQTWFMVMLPLLVAMAVATFYLIRRIYPVKVTGRAFELTIRRIRILRKNLGVMRVPEWIILMILLATLFALAFLTGPDLSIASIMLFSAIAVFVFNLVDWSDVQRTIDWGIIFMFGGAIVLGSAVAQTDAGSWMITRLTESMDLSPRALVVTVFGAGLILSQILSNSAVLAAFLPVLGQMVLSDRLPGYELAEMSIALSAVLGYAASLPISSPTAALVFSTGFFKLREMFIPGMVFATVGFVLFFAFARWVWPWWKIVIA